MEVYMANEIKNSYGLRIDVSVIREICNKMKDSGALNHTDIVIVNGTTRVSMTVDEFIEKVFAVENEKVH